MRTDLLTHTTRVSNLLALYGSACESDRVDGLAWYPKAHAIIAEWAATYDRSLANVACITAALSPQCEWERNLVIAADILAGNPPSIGGAIHSFVRVAEAIRDDNAQSLDGYFKIGCKVRSFACNLAGDYRIVTVDTHAGQAADGTALVNARLDTWQRYVPYAEAYAEAAALAGVDPAAFQAICWLAWKRLYPHKQSVRRAAGARPHKRYRRS